MYGGTGESSSLDRPEREGAPRTHWKLMVKKKRARYDFVQVGDVHIYNLVVYTLYSTAWRSIRCRTWQCTHHRAWQCNHCAYSLSVHTLGYSLGVYTMYSFAFYTLYSLAVKRQYSLAVITLNTAQLQQLQQPLDHEQIHGLESRFPESQNRGRSVVNNRTLD